MATKQQIQQWALSHPEASTADVEAVIRQYGVTLPEIDAALMPMYYAANPQERAQYRTLWDSILSVLGSRTGAGTPEEATSMMLGVAAAGGYPYHPATVDSPYHQAAVLETGKIPMTPERNQALQAERLALQAQGTQQSIDKFQSLGASTPYLERELAQTNARRQGLLSTGTLAPNVSGATFEAGLLGQGAGGGVADGPGSTGGGAGSTGQAFIPPNSVSQFIPPNTGTYQAQGVPGWLLQYGTPLQGGLPWITTPLYGANGLRFGGFR